MNEMTAVRRAVDRLLVGALGPMLDILAEDVEFEVAGGGDVPACRKDSGKQPVVDYFTALGGLVAFWQMDYTATGVQVIAWGKEKFMVEHCGLEGGCEFALVFDLSEGMISRLLVIEDLAALAVKESPGSGGRGEWRGHRSSAGSWRISHDRHGNDCLLAARATNDGTPQKAAQPS